MKKINITVSIGSLSYFHHWKYQSINKSKVFNIVKSEMSFQFNIFFFLIADLPIIQQKNWRSLIKIFLCSHELIIGYNNCYWAILHLLIKNTLLTYPLGLICDTGFHIFNFSVENFWQIAYKYPQTESL